MAVAYDASSESHASTTGSVSQTSFSWTHTPVGTPKGVLVFTFSNADASTADVARSVTYGGWALTPITGGRAVDSAGEPGDCKTWLLSPHLVNAAGSWAAVASPGFTASVNAADYNGGYWVAVADSGAIRTATTLTGTWAAASSPGFSTASIKDVAYGGGFSGGVSGWVAVGASGNVRTATDPTGTWSAASSPGFSTTTVNQVAYSNGYWVAVGTSGGVRTATDPTGTWTAASSPGFGTNSVNGVAYGGGFSGGGSGWVAVGAASSVRTATDPTGTWSAASSPGFSAAVNSVAYGNGYWVAVGDSGAIRWATDPTGTWTAATISGASGNGRSVSYGNGVWLATFSGAIFYTTDPTGTWTAASAGVQPSTALVGEICFGEGKWVVVGRAGEVDFTGAIRYASDTPLALPTGAQTVQVNRSNTIDEMYAVAITVTGDYYVEATGVSLAQTDGTLAEVNTDDGSPGTNSLRFAGINSGLAAIVTNAASPGANNLSSGANSTWAQSIDYGTRVAGVVYETTAGQGSRPVGFSATTSDDRAAVYLAIREAIVPWTVGIPIR